jgi:hypothetical protein
VNIRVKTFGDTYEEMSFNLNHTISKIKKELANKILVQHDEIRNKVSRSLFYLSLSTTDINIRMLNNVNYGTATTIVSF